ncbi:MAG: LysM peptidoglycan-binding domain-containing protein [Methanothrix sp.]|nr:MAG: LysM peptidoglycan-binding domain-containing protein [Methanothrix sp.]
MPNSRTQKAQKSFGQNLKKAKIIVLKKDFSKEREISVNFNPLEYTLSKDANWVDANKKDRNRPQLQFQDCGAETLSMDLFFDTYETGEDVRKYTDPIAKLIFIDPELHRPPTVRVAWGSFIFDGVVTSTKLTPTLFLSNGVPVRAKVAITIKEYGHEANAANRELNSSDRTRAHIVHEGDSLWSIAAKFYNDAAKWKYIADKNSISNPRLLDAGMRLEIPPL